MKIYKNKKKGDFKIGVYPRKFLLKFYDEKDLDDVEYELVENTNNKTITIKFKKTRSDT